MAVKASDVVLGLGLVTAGVGGVLLYRHLTKEEEDGPPPDGDGPPPIEYFSDLAVIYEKKEAVMGKTFDEQVQEELRRLLNPGPTNLALSIGLARFVGSPAYPIDCFEGSTIRSTFTFDFRGEAASYRFEVWMTHSWPISDVALVFEERGLPRTEEITRMTVVFETQIPTIPGLPDIGRMYGAEARIHGALGDIIWTPNVLNVFRVFPSALIEYFANLAVAYT